MDRKFSHSQSRLFKQCPLRYQKAYIGPDRKKELPTDCMSAGSDGHREIADYLKGGVKPAFLPQNFDNFISRLGTGDWLIEEKIDIDFFGFSLVGYLDLAVISNQKGIVVDWKTGYMDGEPEQLKTYAAGLSERYPDVQVFVCYFYYTSKGGHYDREVYTRDEILAFLGELEESLSKINDAAEYKPSPGTHCKTCPHSWDCFALKKIEAGVMIRNEQEFLEVFRRKELADAYAEQAKDVMKQYMTENGLTAIIDGIAKAYLGTTVTMRSGKLKKEEIVDIILEHDCNQDKKALGKLKVQELADLLSEISAKGIQSESKEEAVEQKLIEEHIDGCVVDAEFFPDEATLEEIPLCSPSSMIDMSNEIPDVVYLSGGAPVDSPQGIITTTEATLEEIPVDEIPFADDITYTEDDLIPFLDDGEVPRGIEIEEKQQPGLDVHEVNSATKKDDLLLAFRALLAGRNETWEHYCHRRGLCVESPLDGLTREKMYQEYKILAREKPAEITEKIGLGMIRDAVIAKGLIDDSERAWKAYMNKVKKQYEVSSLLLLTQEQKRELI